MPPAALGNYGNRVGVFAGEQDVGKAVGGDISENDARWIVPGGEVHLGGKRPVAVTRQHARS
jgi:hypothetical protein